jgi:hypothetical protein
VLLHRVGQSITIERADRLFGETLSPTSTLVLEVDVNGMDPHSALLAFALAAFLFLFGP